MCVHGIHTYVDARVYEENRGTLRYTLLPATAVEHGRHDHDQGTHVYVHFTRAVPIVKLPAVIRHWLLSNDW